MITFETIKARAFQNWLDRGRPEGTPEVDWITAVVELSLEEDAKRSEEHTSELQSR